MIREDREAKQIANDYYQSIRLSCNFLLGCLFCGLLYCELPVYVLAHS